ncbi:MAG: hypothetical protein AAF705_02835 [Bacteroidota bacterium]
MPKENEVSLNCLRCGGNMTIVGVKKFDEGTDWSNWLGEWGNLLNRKEKLDMLGCIHCGKVEFYFHGILTKKQTDEES